MTINHVFVWVSRANMAQLRSFYASVFQPLGYKEMLRANNDNLIGYGSDYPYFWLKALPDDKTPLPTHIAFDAPNNEAVNDFHRIAIKCGGKDNGGPGIRQEMSRQPYYAAFIHDPEGNNIEAVCVPK